MTGTTQEVLFEEGGPEGQTGYTGNYTPVRVLALERLQGQKPAGRGGGAALLLLRPLLPGDPPGDGHCPVRPCLGGLTR